MLLSDAGDEHVLEGRGTRGGQGKRDMGGGLLWLRKERKMEVSAGLDFYLAVRCGCYGSGARRYHTLGFCRRG